MFSQAVEYSMRAMALLTQHHGTPLTVQTIAERAQIPAPYLSKLLQTFTRAGLVAAQRGVGGGYVLTRSPAKISLADVINVVEPLQRIRSCPLGIAGHASLCPLHRKVDEALATVEKAFTHTNLAELCKDAGAATPLCSKETLTSLKLPAKKATKQSER